MNGLKKAFAIEFNIHEGHLLCHQAHTILSPDEFKLDKLCWFEGASNAAGQLVLYAFSSTKFGMKGLLVSIPCEVQLNNNCGRIKALPIWKNLRDIFEPHIDNISKK